MPATATPTAPTPTPASTPAPAAAQSTQTLPGGGSAKDIGGSAAEDAFHAHLKKSSEAAKAKQHEPAKPADTKPTTPKKADANEPKPDETPKKDAKKERFEFQKTETKEDGSQPADGAKKDDTDNPDQGEGDLKPGSKEYNWAQAKADKARLETSLKAATAQHQKELESLTKERDTYRDIVKKVALERDPEFQQKYDRPIKNIVNLVKGEIPVELDPDMKKTLIEIFETADFKNPRLDTIYDSLDPKTVSKLRSMEVNIQSRLLEKTEELNNSKNGWEAMQQAEAARQAKDLEQNQAAFDGVLTQARDAYPEILGQKEGDTNHNSMASELESTMRDIMFGNLQTSELMKVAVLAPLAPVFQKAFMTERALRIKAEEQIKSLTSSIPGLGSQSDPGRSAASGSASKLIAGGMTFEQVAEARLRGGS